MYKKLNARGFSHDMLLVLIVMICGIVGVGYMVASHANAATVMYDTCLPSTVPASAKVVAGYVSGPCADIPAIKQRFPHAAVITINEHPGDDQGADIWGIEVAPNSGKTVSSTIDAIASGKVHGVYGSAADLQAVKAGLSAKGVARSSYVLWLWGAGTLGQSAIPAGYDAHQYKTNSNYDVSTISPTFVSVATGGQSSSAARSKKPKTPRVSKANPSNCRDITAKTATAKGTRDALWDYNFYKKTVNGSTTYVRDHILTTKHDNAYWAKKGYCNAGDMHGYAYLPTDRASAIANNAVAPLYQFINSDGKHYYAIASYLDSNKAHGKTGYEYAPSAPATFGRVTSKSIVAYVSPSLIGPQVAQATFFNYSLTTHALERVHNPQTNTYYYNGTYTAIDGYCIANPKGPGFTAFQGPAFYVWNRADGDDTAPTTASQQGSNTPDCSGNTTKAAKPAPDVNQSAGEASSPDTSTATDSGSADSGTDTGSTDSSADSGN